MYYCALIIKCLGKGQLVILTNCIPFRRTTVEIRYSTRHADSEEFKLGHELIHRKVSVFFDGRNPANSPAQLRLVVYRKLLTRF